MDLKAFHKGQRHRGEKLAQKSEMAWLKSLNGRAKTGASIFCSSVYCAIHKTTRPRANASRFVRWTAPMNGQNSSIKTSTKTNLEPPLQINLCEVKASPTSLLRKEENVGCLSEDYDSSSYSCSWMHAAPL